jgi:hypothetical protein
MVCDQFQSRVSSEPEALMRALFKQVTVTKDDAIVLKNCVKELTHLLAQVGYDWQVRPFGSAVHGFGTRFSDLDLCCYQEAGSEGSPELTIQQMQEKLLPLLHLEPHFQVDEASSNPFRLRFSQSVDVNLMFCNTEPFVSTQMLKAYSLLDPKVRRLVVLVKLWAEGEQVCAPRQGYLSPYALTLMTLYFLQVDAAIQMPCLPTEIFDGKTCELHVHNVQWSCPLTLPALLHRFFRFYAGRFMWNEEVVSVRMGKRNSVTHNCYARLPHSPASKQLHIEDPFHPERNLVPQLKLPNEHILRMKMYEAFSMLQSCATPHGLSVAYEMYSNKQSPPVETPQAPAMILATTMYSSINKDATKRDDVYIDDLYNGNATAEHQCVVAASVKIASAIQLSVASLKSASKWESDRELTTLHLQNTWNTSYPQLQKTVDLCKIAPSLEEVPMTCLSALA